MSIKNIADSLSKKYLTRNPLEIIKGMNVILVYAPLVGVNGFYQYYQRNHIIYINEDLSDEEKKFVCAHELGHMFLHRHANAIFMDTYTRFNTNRYELEADTFAMDLLVGDEILLEYYTYSTEQLSRLLGYREELIKLRLKERYQI